jgi:regulatory protein
MVRSAKESKRKDVHERALGLLAVRARSRRELEQRLLQAGYPAVEVGAELDRLERVGLIDDAAFARQLVQHAFGAGGKGRRAVASALFAKGVDPEVAASTLEDLGGDEEQRAFDLASSRAPRLGGIDPQKAFQRLSGLLMRRGFAPELARSAARRALAVGIVED